MNISTIILSYNSEKVLAETIRRAFLVSDDVHVVDSFSNDNSVQIAKDSGATVVEHEFTNYGQQRNWAIEELPLKHGWQLHLDADERVSDELVDEILKLEELSTDSVSGFYIPRRTIFMGRELRFGGFFPIYHMRLFKAENGRCEERLYDQHFHVEGATKKLNGELKDDMQMSLSDWTIRHTRWAELEMQEQLSKNIEGRIQGDISGNPIEKKRALRGLYSKMPLFLRAFIFFKYRYILRLGFLDGVPGLIYCVLQTFWYRFLVDAKLYEHQLELERKANT